jgi:hypothetical protein
MAAVQHSERERNESEVNVLVMCQRKTGKCSSDTSNNIEDEGMTIDKIKTFCSDYFNGKKVNIEYLTDLTVWRDLKDTSDYNFPLIRTNSEALDFIQSHTDFYDAVMLNTCPLHNIDFLAILTILKEGGCLIIKNYGCNDNPPMSLDSQPFKSMNKFDNDIVLNVINSYFDTTGSSTIFVKNLSDLGGGTRKRKQRHRKRSNRKTKLRRLKKLK